MSDQGDRLKTERKYDMERKILLAVDDSIQTRNAIRYAVRISAFVKDLTYTLLRVQPDVSQFLVDEAAKSVKAKMALDKLKKKNAEKALETLEKFKTQMIEAGIDAQRIDLKTVPKKIGLAKDILEFAQERLYDAIVVGRRGLSKLQEVIMGSLTTNLLEHSRLIPVWVIDGEVASDKIMIATDGSESALRAVDHFSFMAARNPNIDVTLFHVVPRLKDVCKIDFDEEDKELEEMVISGDKKCVESFMIHAHKKFEEMGVPKEQIHIKEGKVISNVGKAIVEEIKKGDYGTVVAGRRGTGKAFFMGSVSNYVLNNTSDRALWLVP